ncbi:MAG TPA: response regulator, partial [Acetobacteraceae bacterium]|nr:response regulator [Acetobacteraceae bacterium]
RTGELSMSKLELQHANTALEKRVAERTLALAERTSALEVSEARFRAWFDHAEDAVFVVQVEPDGRFRYEAVNAAVERVFGVDAESCLGRTPGAVLPPGMAAAVVARFKEAAQGAPIQFEARVSTPIGNRLLDTWLVPLRNPVNGRVERLVGASRDITERHALETRLAQAQKLQALGGLAGGIAHDFNNILQAVAGAAALMEHRPEDRETIQRLARRTIAAADRGTSITRRLLAFARSDELRVEALQTADVLESLCEVLTYTLSSTISVKLSLAPDLPKLLADRGQLETALVNLGTNARDAMPNGGSLTLAAGAELVADGAAHPAGLAPGPYVRIDVTDTGCGMDAATLARVVEPFFTTKPPGQGTGLGLALVKGFTEQSGGGMAIESTPDVGTTVRIWLRQAVAETAPLVTTHTGEKGAEATQARILVVDDDDLVRETMAEQLEGGGFSVVSAASGAEALAAIETAGRPDALVCDLSMPGMNGIDTIKRVRDLLPGLPCFLLTGYAGERAMLETGNAFTLLRKPMSARALIAEIDAGLAAGRR